MASAPNRKQRACREPLYDIHPLTGISIEVFYSTARWRHSAGAALAGFGGRAAAVFRQTARRLAHLQRATPRIGTR